MGVSSVVITTVTCNDCKATFSYEGTVTALSKQMRARGWKRHGDWIRCVKCREEGRKAPGKGEYAQMVARVEQRVRSR
jgi:hypothetical protein